MYYPREYRLSPRSVTTLLSVAPILALITFIAEWRTIFAFPYYIPATAIVCCVLAYPVSQMTQWTKPQNKRATMLLLLNLFLIAYFYFIHRVTASFIQA